MTEEERIEENHKRNKPFNTAFKFFADYLVNGSQKDMCELMGVQAPRVSEVIKDKKPVNDKLINALINLSAKKGMQIYSEYLYGHSDTMLLENVTDEEMAEVSLRKSNPDYEKMKKQKENQEQNQQPPAVTTIDPSSAVNAAISAYAQLIEAKDAVIAELEARITDLQRTISDKESIIHDRDARITTLERQLAAAATSDLSRYPFTIGAAEDNKQPNI
jgi:plasmid maintenance system antidote protein VapI